MYDIKQAAQILLSMRNDYLLLNNKVDNEVVIEECLQNKENIEHKVVKDQIISHIYKTRSKKVLSINK